QQTLATQTGAIGVYGNVSLGGMADLDLALIGGLSAHTSKRQVIANNQVQTATGLFTSYFFAPSAALSVPVLSGDAGTLLFKTSATYVGGLTSAYTETGSAMNLAVGSQTISVFDVRAGLEGRHDIGTAGGMSGTLTAKAGVFAQINAGSASVPVTTLGQTINIATPGSSAYGVYGGVGFESQLSEALKLTMSADGSIRTDGLTSLSIKGGLAGTF
ncbi:MAG: autotransporter domain-containing protein, partial [Devosia sp.]